MNDKPAYWRDVGTVDAYWEANMDLTRVTPDLNLYDKDWPIWTHQEQLPPAKFVFDDEGRRGMAVDSRGIRRLHHQRLDGARVRCCSRTCACTAYGSIEDSVILPDVDSEPPRASCAAWWWTSAACCPKASRSGFDPEEDRKRFHVSERGITLITPEMLGQEVFTTQR